MRRWHEERDLMLNRWRMEIDKHEGKGAEFPPSSCDVDDCHCFRGMGFLRKHKPFDCGQTNCGLCHIPYACYRAQKKRDRREAFAREWDASGGW